jgi:multiple sugar transport system permease protein
VVVPNAYGIAAAVGTITFIGSWNAFLWPLLIGQDQTYRTVQVSLSQFLTSQRVDIPQLFIGAAVAIVPVLLVFVFLQRYLVRGVEQSGID